MYLGYAIAAAASLGARAQGQGRHVVPAAAQIRFDARQYTYEQLGPRRCADGNGRGFPNFRIEVELNPDSCMEGCTELDSTVDKGLVGFELAPIAGCSCLFENQVDCTDPLPQGVIGCGNPDPPSQGGVEDIFPSWSTSIAVCYRMKARACDLSHAQIGRHCAGPWSSQKQTSFYRVESEEECIASCESQEQARGSSSFGGCCQVWFSPTYNTFSCSWRSLYITASNGNDNSKAVHCTRSVKASCRSFENSSLGNTCSGLDYFRDGISWGSGALSLGLNMNESQCHLACERAGPGCCESHAFGDDTPWGPCIWSRSTMTRSGQGGPSKAVTCSALGMEAEETEKTAADLDEAATHLKQELSKTKAAAAQLGAELAAERPDKDTAVEAGASTKDNDVAIEQLQQLVEEVLAELELAGCGEPGTAEAEAEAHAAVENAGGSEEEVIELLRELVEELQDNLAECHEPGLQAKAAAAGEEDRAEASESKLSEAVEELRSTVRDAGVKQELEDGHAAEADGAEEEVEEPESALAQVLNVLRV